MPTIEMQPDRASQHIYWLTWVERQEVIAQIVQEPNGDCRVIPRGTHWSPMKSFAGARFGSPDRP